MNSGEGVEVTALAINVTIPEELRWTDTRRGEAFTLTTLNVRLLADGHLAARAYGRPVGGGRGAYVSFAVPESQELTALITAAASRAGTLWANHRGLRLDTRLAARPLPGVVGISQPRLTAAPTKPCRARWPPGRARAMSRVTGGYRGRSTPWRPRSPRGRGPSPRRGRC